MALPISGGAEFHLTAAEYDSECKPKRERETLGRTRPLDTCECLSIILEMGPNTRVDCKVLLNVDFFEAVIRLRFKN